MNTKELLDVINAVLAPAGFRRRKETWYRANEDTVTLVNLQKSQWGGQFFVNLAVYLRALGNAASPAEHQAHIRVRLTSIAGESSAPLDEALDLERAGISTESRASRITAAMIDVALPFLTDRSVVPALRQLYATGQLGPVLLVKDARRLLEDSSG
jgi:hypothetical protein